MKLFMYIGLACVLALTPTLLSYPSSHKLAVMANEVMRCDQGYDECDPTHCSNSTLGKAWDFNLSGTTGDGDLGLPVLACADGRVVYAQNYIPGQSDAWGNCIVVKYDNDASNHRGMYAHVEQILVKVGECVKQGQVIGTIGKGDGNYSAHLHYQVQSGDDPDASSVSATFSDVGFPTSPNSYTSLNHNIFDLEKAADGNPVGNENGAVHWWPQVWGTGDKYDGNNCAQKCYLQDYHNGTWGDCGIVYDGLGGARKAYTVRTGFWNNDQSNGWAQQNGPQSSLGMPITNEYLISSGARQEFQKGYMIFENNSVSVVTYSSVGKVAPGWTSSGWNNQYSYLFALVYERNGGAPSVGLPASAVYSYGDYGYLRQDYSGGSYGNCCIMYDPSNAIGNEFATNEAYLIRTGFYDFYQANGGSSLGCPTRDEYSSRDPEHWDQTTEYPLQNFFDRGAYNNHELSQHYMIWKNGSASYHSAYTTSFVSQTPSGQFNMAQGAIRSFTVQFKNTGSNTWYNSSSYLDAYVELKSCDANGATCASFLNYPYSGSLGWINEQAPCTMTQSSVAPSGTATFTFTGKVASNASLGLHNVYFRPNHSVGGLMSDWGGMHYVVNVVRRTKFDFDGDGIADYWDRTSTGEFHLDYAANNLTEWDTTFYGYGGSQDTPCPADYDGDGKYDIGILRNSDRKFLIDYADNGFGSYDVTNLGGYGGYFDYPCPADYDGDGRSDIAVRDTLGYWRIDFAANGFGSWDWTGSGYGGFYDRPCPADYDGDGKADLAILRNSDRKYLIDYAANGFNGWDETNLGGYGGYYDYPCPADYDNDGKDDIAVLNTTDRCWRVDRSGNGFGGWDYVLGGYGGSGDRPMPADYDGDGWDDLATYYAAYDQICLDYASNNYGSWDWCDDGPDHPTWKAATEATIPLVFSLSQNHPNPFNPTTTISYSVPEATHVFLSVYNILGQEVARLVNTNQPAGNYSVSWDASSHPSGIYLYRLQTDQAQDTRKMLILK